MKLPVLGCWLRRTMVCCPFLTTREMVGSVGSACHEILRVKKLIDDELRRCSY